MNILKAPGSIEACRSILDTYGNGTLLILNSVIKRLLIHVTFHNNRFNYLTLSQHLAANSEIRWNHTRKLMMKNQGTSRLSTSVTYYNRHYTFILIFTCSCLRSISWNTVDCILKYCARLMW